MVNIEFRTGDAVSVYSFGTWYPGVVERTTVKRVFVRYKTGTGRERVKAYGKQDSRLASEAIAARLGRSA
jgi:hypothetical protein